MKNKTPLKEAAYLATLKTLQKENLISSDECLQYYVEKVLLKDHLDCTPLIEKWEIHVQNCFVYPPKSHVGFYFYIELSIPEVIYNKAEMKRWIRSFSS